jgi:two-component system, cell cycle sensor histidine kinase and response regulator CckA
MTDKKSKKGGNDLLTDNHFIYSSVIKEINIPACFLDPKGIFLIANPYCDSLFGAEKEKLTGKNLKDFVGSGSFKKIKSEIKKEDILTEFEIPAGKEKKKTLRSFSFPKYNSNGKYIGSLIFLEDITEKKNSEAKLQERIDVLQKELGFKNNLLSSLLNKTPDHIYFKDKKSRFVAVSKSQSDWIGVDSPEEMIGKTDFDFFTKEHAEQVFSDEQKIIKTGKSIQAKIEKETYPDGRVTWVSTTKVPRFDEKGKIIGTLGISRDVTQEKEKDEQLKESEARNRAILSALPDLLFQIKKDGTFLSYYAGSKDSLFTKPENFTGKKMEDVLPKDIARQGKQRLKEAIKTGRTVSFEYQLPIKDKIKEWEARFTRTGKETAIVLIRDITEMEKAEREISKLNDLIEQSTSAILRMNTEKRIDYANRATKDLFGYTFSDLKGKPLELLMAELNSEEVCRNIFKKVSKGEAYSGEHLSIKKNGSVFFCFIKIMPLFDENNKIYSYMASLTDITQERKAREELVFRKNLLDSFLELTPDKVFFKDRDCRFVEVSKSKAEKYNLAREEMIGKSDFSFHEKETAEKYFEEEQNIMSKEEPLLNQEEKYLAPDGKVHWASYTKVPRYDKDGNVIGIIGISRDITNLKRAEEELRREEELLSNTLESMEDGILVMDKDFHFTYWNNSMERITGIQKNKAINSKKVPWEIFPNLKYAKVDGMMKKAMEGEVVKRDKIPYELKDGTRIFTSEMYLPLKNPDGYIYGIVGVVKEITKEIETEETLKESEEKYRILVENSREGICIFRVNKFLFVNNHLCHITGYSKEELYGMEVWEIIDEDDRNIVKEMERRREKGEEMPDVYEANIITKRGDLRFCEFSIRQITYQGIESSMGIIRDITEYKDMEKEREKADRLESLGVLAGGIAHDFNNFLTGILGNISLAKLHLDPKDDAYDILQESESAAQSARSLTQQLLTFSKGGSPVKVNTNVEDLIRNSANFVLSGSNVRCDLEFPENLWDIKADKGQLSQVFNNLILNADQAMPEGGHITIRAKNLMIEEDAALPLKKDKHVMIEVQDRGIGIPEEVLSKIFDPFFTTKQKGSGLGLSTVFSIIKRHEGYVTVKSELEKGTSFLVYLPAVDKEKAKAEETKIIPKGKGKILIMDDKSFVRNAAIKALTMFGYEVKGASNGEEALSMYKKAMSKDKPFELIILDLTIPGGMGGEDTLKGLRKINPDVKAIVSSGYSDNPVMSEFKKHGFNAMVRKPYQYEELCEIVRKVLKENQ